MHTVEMMEQLLNTATRLGYRIRHEWLGGSGGGMCEFGGRKWLFIDLALSTTEQLEQVVEALRTDPAIHVVELSPAQRRALDLPRAA